MTHARLQAPATASLRGNIAIDLPDTAFAREPHRVDVRSMSKGGRYGIANVGIFLWRIQSNHIELAAASRVDDRRYLFSPLECDMPLFTLADDEAEIESLSGPLEVPLPISRSRLAAAMQNPRRHADYYGAARSLHIVRDGVVVPPAEICVCNLEDSGASWANIPDDAQVAVDPERGRIAFPSDQPAPLGVTVSYSYGSAADIGGGPYPRPASSHATEPGIAMRHVPADFPTIQEAIDSLPPAGGIVEVTDNRRYVEALSITAAADASIELRARVGARPYLSLTADLAIAGAETSTVTLDGFLISADASAPSGSPGRVVVGGELGTLRIAHCTLVPGLRLMPDGAPLRPGEPSLLVDVPTTQVQIERTFLGPVRLATDTALELRDSAIDATAPDRIAIAGIADDDAGGRLTLVATTVIGNVRAAAMDLISDCILDSSVVLCDRKQEGCVRFSYVPLRSITPRRFRCQPELQIAAEIERRERDQGSPLSAIASERIRAHVAARLVPSFTSTSCAHPAYLQLRDSCSLQIRTGASDESEMGVYHLLFQPQRAANLRERLDEYVRFGLEAVLLHAN
jgi:hypothetical protein